jgi:hypothetical protein
VRTRLLLLAGTMLATVAALPLTGAQAYWISSTPTQIVDTPWMIDLMPAAPRSEATGQQAYRQAMIGPTYDMLLVMRARICGLRSEGWARSFDIPFQFKAQDEHAKARISNDEVLEAEKAIQADALAVLEKYRSCRAILESGELDRLDALQWHLTGGYH